MPQNIYDITIIGGGPVGLFTAFYAGLRRARTKVIESLDELGGQPHHLFGEKFIYDIPAYPRILGRELTHVMVEQAKRFRPTMITGEEAIEIHQLEDENGIYYEIKTQKNTHYSRTIIIAAGNGAFAPRRLQLDHSQQLEGKQLHYFVRDIQRFQDRRVVVCGGGDSAVDWALALEHIAKEVTLVHRRPKFRAHERSIYELEQSSVNVLTPFVPSEFHLEDNQLTGLTIEKPRSDEKRHLDIDDIIVSYGFVSSFGAINDWGLDIERGAIQVEPTTMKTNRPGVYAVGDIAGYPGKIKLIATGFGEAPQAVASAMQFIHPDKPQTIIHSSYLLEGE